MVRKVNKQKHVLLVQTFIEGYVSVTASRLVKNTSKSLYVVSHIQVRVMDH